MTRDALEHLRDRGTGPAYIVPTSSTYTLDGNKTKMFTIETVMYDAERTKAWIRDEWRG